MTATTAGARERQALAPALARPMRAPADRATGRRRHGGFRRSHVVPHPQPCGLLAERLRQRSGLRHPRRRVLPHGMHLRRRRMELRRAKLRRVHHGAQLRAGGVLRPRRLRAGPVGNFGLLRRLSRRRWRAARVGAGGLDGSQRLPSAAVRRPRQALPLPTPEAETAVLHQGVEQLREEAPPSTRRATNTTSHFSASRTPTKRTRCG